MKTEILQDDKKIIAKLAGRLDTAAAAEFTNDIQPLKDNADKDIVLDFTDLEFISSSGLRILLTIRKETIAKGGSVTIKNVSPDIEQVFEITGFKTLFVFE